MNFLNRLINVRRAFYTVFSRSFRRLPTYIFRYIIFYDGLAPTFARAYLKIHDAITFVRALGNSVE